MATNQKAFRFYEDGSESGSVAIDTQDTNISEDNTGDSVVLLRILVEATGIAIDTEPDPDWRLQYRKNSGTWTNVTTSSSNVKGFASSSLTDGGATTNRLTGGTGTFIAGLVSEDGLADGSDPQAGQFTEYLFALTLIDADTVDTDTLDFRLLRDGSTLDTYTVTPRVTISKSGGGGGGNFPKKTRLLLVGVG